jgi:soluble lytic murein transglycosylase-like protein
VTLNRTLCLTGGAVSSAVVLLAFAAAPARAQVIDISADGLARTYSGPVISSADGIRPIAPATSRRRAGSARTDSAEVNQAIHDASDRRGISAPLVEAVAWQESRLDQRRVSPMGARGVMQLMPATSRDLGVDAGDLAANVDGGTAYLAQLMRAFDGDLIKTLAAYNAGPAAVRRYGGVPPYPETRAYVAGVLDRLAHTAAAQSPTPEAR